MGGGGVVAGGGEGRVEGVEQVSMGGVNSDNCKNLNTTNMLQELITLQSR